MAGHHEDLVGCAQRGPGAVGNERGHRFRQVQVGHRQSGPPGTQQDRRALPAGTDADVHQVPGAGAQLVDQQAGDLRRPVGQRGGGQLSAEPARIGGQPRTVRVTAQQRAE